MDSFWKQYCRMCLGTINNENFDKILIITQEILDVLLLKLDLDKNNQGMCQVCALKVMEGWKFKSMCLCTDKTIIPYVDDKTGKFVDLLEIYAKEKRNLQLTNTLRDHKVCRLCMKLIKDKFMSIHEVESDAIERYIPEINISLTEDPVVCKECFESIGTHSSFIKNCLDVDEKIKSFYSDGSYSPSRLLASDLCIKTEDTVIKQELSECERECMENKYTLEILKSEDQYQIKTECIDIKSEEDSESEAHPETEDESANCINKGNSSLNSVEVDNNKYSFNEHTSTLAHHHMTPQEEHRFVHKDGMNQRDTRGHKSKRNRDLKSHRSILETNLFKCGTCGFKTKQKGSLNKHMLIHKDVSEIEVFECNACDFKTKWKSNFRKHTLKYNHEDIIKNREKNCSETKVFVCDTCDFKTKYKDRLKRHQLKHKDIPEMEVFTCDTCSFVTKYTNSLKAHQLRHKDISEMKVFTCDTCHYKAKHESQFKRHLQTHKHNSEFECDTCGYKTNLKSSIKKHMLKHKGFAETEVFTCDTCDFKTKYKNSLKTHQVTHKDNEFECDTCGYRSKQKRYLRMHLIMQPTHYATCCTRSRTT